MRLPEELKEQMVRVHGAPGRRWLADLPALLEGCRRRWSLELGEPFADLSYNFVLPARDSRGAEVVLKLAVPCRELLTEAAALTLFAGRGAVRLLDHDTARGALLLERVLPGSPLYEQSDEPAATRTAARLMRRLWREPPDRHAFPSLAVWFGAFERHRNLVAGGDAPFPPELFARAERTFLELNASSARAVILHGDLHHANILSTAGGGWVAIDPKGICGDAGYEVGTFMLNRLPPAANAGALADVLRRRLLIFSEELQIERGRLARWAFCHAVLSALWDIEESADCGRVIRLARVLGQL